MRRVDPRARHGVTTRESLCFCCCCFSWFYSLLPLFATWSPIFSKICKLCESATRHFFPYAGSMRPIPQWAHLAPSGSHSKQRIRFVLPKGAASCIIKRDNRQTQKEVLMNDLRDLKQYGLLSRKDLSWSELSICVIHYFLHPAGLHKIISWRIRGVVQISVF